MGYKQIIIVRKDLHMSPGKMSAQVSHGSMAFLTHMIRRNACVVNDVNVGRAWRYEAPKLGETIEQAQERIKNHPEERKPQTYKRGELCKWAHEARERGDDFFYYRPVNPKQQDGDLELCEKQTHIETTLSFDNDLYHEWIEGAFTKIVLEAKNRNNLLKAQTMAENLGMTEGNDFFLIRDNCYTELQPEEIDENGVGRTLTCIGFKPMSAERIDPIARKFNMYR